MNVRLVKMIGWCIAAMLVLMSLAARGYSNLDAAYAALGFNPRASSNAVVVLFSDAHMNLDPSVLPISTNLDPRLVNIINAMDPPPARVMVSGDVSTTPSPIPGWEPRGWSMEFGTNEMNWWLRSSTTITNLPATNVLWVPGNHDQLHFETNAETFRMMFPEMPTRQRVDVAGTRFFLLNCGNYGARNAPQMAWLQEEVARTPTNQPIVVVTHVPPFHAPPIFRGNALDLREVLGSWPARWWTFGGHYHSRSFHLFRVWNTTVASLVVGTANPLNTYGKSYDSGSLFLCLSNGIAGVVYYHYNDASFEAVSPPAWDNPRTFLAAFEGIPGLIWRHLKTRERSPEETAYVADDAIEWYAYAHEIHWSFPRDCHRNQATHFALLAVQVTPGAYIEFSADSNAWERVVLSTSDNNIYSVPIPPTLVTQSVIHVRFMSPMVSGDLVGGWGFTTTNPPPWLPPIVSVTNIARGEVWRYDDRGLDLGAEWPKPNYDDSSWGEGVTPLGYGGSYRGAMAGNGGQPPTVYFRRCFEVRQTIPPTSLIGRLRRDDGAVVYLNGTEVFRDNLPSGPVSFWTPALACVEGDRESEFISFPMPTNLVRTGTNVLAVEVHQCANQPGPDGGPVALWSFDELQPPWKDSVGTNTFSVVGSGLAAWTGKYGGSVANTGSASDYLIAADSPSLRYSSPFTVGGWFAFGQGSFGQAVGLKKEGEFSLYYTGSTTNRYRFEVNGVFVQDETCCTVVGQWRFVLGWFDGTNVHIQVDDGPVYSAAALPPASTTNPLVALKEQYNGGGLAADEVFFYKGLLSVAERALWYQGHGYTNRSDLGFDFELTMTAGQLPQIVSAPLDAVRRVGENAVFSVNVVSASPLAYQWYYGDQPMVGATNSMIFIGNLASGQAGQYSVTVTNLAGAVTTLPAALSVIGIPEIEASPATNGSACVLRVPGYGVPGVILVSTNLIDWRELMRLPASRAKTNIMDAEVTNSPSRFYRLRLDF